MTVATATDFRKMVDDLFARFDALDFEQLQEMFADDGQGVDEISRGWMRGRSEMRAYFDQLVEMGIGDIHSTVSDFMLTHWDDVALATLMLEQTYTAGGEDAAITAPVSIVFRHDHGTWKIQLVHAVALPDG